MDFSDLPSSHLAPSFDALLLAPTSRARRFRMREARYACRAGEFRRALPLLEKAEASTKRSDDAPGRLECLAFALRSSIELERFDRIALVETSARDVLQAVQSTPGLESRAYALLGACARARATGAGQAEALFNRAIDLALVAGDREAVAQAAYGSASAIYAQGRHEDVLIKIGRLEPLLPALRLPELSSAALLLRGLALRDLGRSDEAIAAIWRSCETLQLDPHLALYARTLAALGSALRAKGSGREARIYLELADKTSRPDDMPALRRTIASELAKIANADMRDGGAHSDADIVFDPKAGVLRVHGREVRLGGQFVLRDLMRAFVERPGHAFGKPEIAGLIWREPYDPVVHDNKIYVTIKRLRRCLEDGRGGRRYVLRAKDGYFFNPKIRVKLI